MLPLVAFSHLRWDFVTQRPQHLMLRLARHYDVLFVEEPVQRREGAELALHALGPRLTLARPATTVGDQGFDQAQHAALRALFARDAHRLARWCGGIAWTWTPLALDLIDAFTPRVLAYDCMDELSAFDGASTALASCEQRLLARADVVFTGGPSLYEAKRARHADVHCLPSSVDAPHFARANDPDTPEHPAQAALGWPRIGFYGVIDERFDVALVDALARLRPQWTFVFAGPVVKISVTALPRRPNLHWLGVQPYAALPTLLKGWDACILPFALNDATRFISPTKLLEYMAADRPIVSTPIRDVVTPYADVVEIAADPAAFAAALDRVLDEPEHARARRQARMRAIVAQTSWDTTVATIDDCLRRALATRAPAAEAT